MAAWSHGVYTFTTYTIVCTDECGTFRGLAIAGWNRYKSTYSISTVKRVLYRNKGINIMWIYWSNISRHQLGSQSLVASGSSKWTMTPSILPKLWQNGLKQSQGIGVAITKPWPQSYRKCVGRTEKAFVSKEAYKPDSVTPALSGGMGQNSPNSLWEACGRLPEVHPSSLRCM